MTPWTRRRPVVGSFAKLESTGSAHDAITKTLAMEIRDPVKQTKTAEELAAMIHADLSQIDGCPKQGVSVTVYGIPWKAMLTFGVAAGPVRNKSELQRFFEAIVERLQRLYEVSL